MLGRGMCSLSALLAVRIVIIHNTKLSYGVYNVYGPRSITSSQKAAAVHVNTVQFLRRRASTLHRHGQRTRSEPETATVSSV